MGLVRHKLFLFELRMLSFVCVDAILHLATELPDETLYGPGSGVAQSANGVSLDLIGQLLEHVDLGEVGVALLHALEHVDHPAGTFTAWSALAAALVLVELSKS